LYATSAIRASLLGADSAERRDRQPHPTRCGTYHASEIVYAFHNLHLSKLATRGGRGPEAVRRDVGLLGQLAKAGDPNGKGLPRWPAYREKSDTALNLGDKIEPIPVPHKAALDFLDKSRGKF
jgi:para-nitrobenzyl esterase